MIKFVKIELSFIVDKDSENQVMQNLREALDIISNEHVLHSEVLKVEGHKKPR